MRRNPLFLKLVLSVFAVFVSALIVLSLATCSYFGNGPEFVGTWKGPLPYGTITLTLTETTFTILYETVTMVLYSVSTPPSMMTGTVNLTADYTAIATETDTGTITSFDTNFKHIQLAVAAVTLTFSTSAVWHVGDTIFMLYSLSGNTLTIACSTTAYPADLTGGFALTKQ